MLITFLSIYYLGGQSGEMKVIKPTLQLRDRDREAYVHTHVYAKIKKKQNASLYEPLTSHVLVDDHYLAGDHTTSWRRRGCHTNGHWTGSARPRIEPDQV